MTLPSKGRFFHRIGLFPQYNTPFPKGQGPSGIEEKDSSIEIGGKEHPQKIGDLKP